MEAILDSVPVGLYRTTPAGDWLEANPAMATLLGFDDVAALLSTKVLDFYIDLSDRERLIAALDASDDRTAKITTILRRRDGSSLWVEVFARRVDDGGVPSLVGMVTDITARRETERARQESEALFRRVFDELPVAAALLSPDGRFHRANEAYCRMVGWSEAELRAMTFIDVTHPEERETSAAQSHDLVSGRVRELDVEKRYVRKDGSTVWGALSLRAINDASGRMIWHMPVVIDVTERRRLEEQLRQSQKMEAIGQLAGGIAHDFNNILTTMMGYCELLLDETPHDTPARDDLQQIYDGGQRAAALTRQLLAFSRKQVLRLEVADLNEVVRKFLALIRPIIGEDVDLDVDLASEPVRLMADVAQLDQVLMNLVVNARDAMPEGGTLRVRTGAIIVEAEEDGADSSGMAPGEYVQLSVEDTGIGMDAETRCRVFEPFFTTKESGKGTGLGLAVVYGIVKQMEGFVSVYSERGRGTTFRMAFPSARQDRPARPAAVVTRDRRTGTERVLLVEDDRDVRTFSAMVLRRYGYDVIEAHDGTEALVYLLHHPLDLLISDVVMPGMSGPDLARRARETVPGLRVLFTSGYLDRRVVASGPLSSDFDLLEKPYTATTLLDRVRAALDSPPVAADL